MAWVYHNKPPMGWPLDLSEPINKGIVGYWYMPEGSGNIIRDLSGNNYIGTFTNSPTWASGKYGSCVDFPGVNEYIESAKNVGGWNEITIVILVKPRETADGGWVAINNSGSGGDKYIGIRRDGSTQARGAIGDGDAQTWYSLTNSSTNSVPVNVWTHIAMTAVVGSSPDIYINGVLDNGGGSASDGAGAMDIGHLFIGAGMKATGNSQISYVMLYNRTLLPSEIALLYRFPFYGFLNPDEIPVLDQYYTVGVGNAGIMTTNTGFWGPTF